MEMNILVLAFVAGAIASVLGGAIGGVLVGGRHIGNEIAAMMGSFYGPLAGIGGVLLGLALYAYQGVILGSVEQTFGRF